MRQVNARWWWRRYERTSFNGSKIGWLEMCDVAAGVIHWPEWCLPSDPTTFQMPCSVCAIKKFEIEVVITHMQQRTCDDACKWSNDGYLGFQRSSVMSKSMYHFQVSFKRKWIKGLRGGLYRLRHRTKSQNNILHKYFPHRNDVVDSVRKVSLVATAVNTDIQIAIAKGPRQEESVIDYRYV